MTMLGTISSGSHRPEDLIPDFVDRLESNLDRLSLSQKRELTRISKRTKLRPTEYYHTSKAANDVQTLADMLQTLAPPFCYFGAHEGNGSDFGFWVSDTLIELASFDKTLVYIKDLSEADATVQCVRSEAGVCPGYVLVVNDHGNRTLYRVDECPGDKLDFVEVWSVV